MPGALADGRNPFYCTNRDEKEVTYPCKPSAAASNKKYGAYNNNDYEYNENEKEDGDKK